MFEEAIPESTRCYLALLAERGLSKPFYLAGGTAAALHMGHRISVDLDFFSPQHFNAVLLDERLKDFPGYRQDSISEDTLIGAINELRISFFWYRYKLLEQPISVLETLVLGLQDLAAMKIEAIAQRNSKRDFIDLYFLATKAGISPQKALEYHQAKFSEYNISRSHLILSMGYFNEAENEPMPKMLEKTSWKEIKDFFSRESRELLRELIE